MKIIEMDMINYVSGGGFSYKPSINNSESCPSEKPSGEDWTEKYLDGGWVKMISKESETSCLYFMDYGSCLYCW